MEIHSIDSALEWFSLIEDGIPEDVAVSRLKEEAMASDAPREYSGSLRQSGSLGESDYEHQPLRPLNEAELLVIRMYCTESYDFYLHLNEDCRNRKWKSYVVYTSLLHSVCMKLGNMPINRGDVLYRGMKCLPKEPGNKNFCWPCFTSATTEKGKAGEFGHIIIELESKSGAPVKQFSDFFEYEILFSPFQVFKFRKEGDKSVYTYLPEPSMFFMSFPHYRGALLGVAVGNCLGHLFDSQKQSVLESVSGFFDKLAAGKLKKGRLRYTSDTSMTIALSKSLTERNGVDISNLKDNFVKEYFNDPDRDYGDSVTDVLKKLRNQGSKEDPFDPAQKQFKGSGSYGNGSAMRIAPAALFFFKANEDEFNEKVREITRLTHYNTSAIHGAILQATAVKLALQFALEGTLDKDIREEFIDKLLCVMAKLEQFSRMSKGEYSERLMKVKEYISNPPSLEIVRKILGNGMSAIDSVPTAIHCFIRGLQPIPEISCQYNGFERTIMYAISLEGDTDTIASMAGAIAGAYYGQDAVTQRLRDACEPKAIEDAKRYSKQLHGHVFKVKEEVTGQSSGRWCVIS